jgi:GrpB-like predicted nucleotidyltransferase (UPF0157 family)
VRIRAVLGPVALVIEHVGSTFVQDYANAKSEIVEEILRRASAEGYRSG